jgi:hypothetical protein
MIMKQAILVIALLLHADIREATGALLAPTTITTDPVGPPVVVVTGEPTLTPSLPTINDAPTLFATLPLTMPPMADPPNDVLAAPAPPLAVGGHSNLLVSPASPPLLFVGANEEVATAADLTTPEPSTITLFGIGVAAGVAYKRGSRRRLA